MYSMEAQVISWTALNSITGSLLLKLEWGLFRYYLRLAGIRADLKIGRGRVMVAVQATG